MARYTDEERVRRHLNAGGYGDPPPEDRLAIGALTVAFLVAGASIGLVIALLLRGF